MGDIKVELLSEKAMYDGTLLSILMKLGMDAEECEIFDSKEMLLKGNHRALVASQGNVPIGILAYNQTKGRIDRLCAKTPEADQKLRVRFAMFRPKMHILQVFVHEGKCAWRVSSADATHNFKQFRC